MDRIRFFNILLLFPFIFSGCSLSSDGTTSTDSTIIDTEPPAVLAFSPNDNQTKVKTNTVVSVSFNEPVAFSSMTVSTSDDVAIISGNFTGYGTNTVVFTPDSNFVYKTDYTATLNNVTDLSGNSLGDVSWIFQTEGTDRSSFTPQIASSGTHGTLDGAYNSLVIDPDNGSIVIAYFDEKDDTIQIMSGAPDQEYADFIDADIADIASSKDNISLMVNDAGYHLVYTNDSGQISYAFSPLTFAGPWTIVSVSSPQSKNGALELDPAGGVHITYYDELNTALRYTTNTVALDGSFTNFLVDDGEDEEDPGRYSSIEYDANGRVNVSYYDIHSANNNGNLKFAVFETPSTSTTDLTSAAAISTIDANGEVGKYSSLALDSQGNAYISYLDITNNTIKLANNHSGYFANEIFVSNVVNETNVPIVIDPNDYIHMSYFSYCSEDSDSIVDFCYAVKAKTTEVGQPIDNTGIGNGIQSSLTYNPNDNKIHFAYYNMTEHDLMYARQK